MFQDWRIVLIATKWKCDKQILLRLQERVSKIILHESVQKLSFVIPRRGGHNLCESTYNRFIFNSRETNQSIKFSQCW